MLLLTIFGIYAWVARLAFQEVLIAKIVAVCGGALFLPFLLYAILYLAVLPFGLLNEILEKQIEAPMSPFASDRLPDQHMQPADDNQRAF